MTDSALYSACEKFVSWLDGKLTAAGRGDELQTLTVEPSGKFWLGRLAPEISVMNRNLGNRGERLEPCACGIRLRTKEQGPWRFVAAIKATIWQNTPSTSNWQKLPRAIVEVQVEIDEETSLKSFGVSEIQVAFQAITGHQYFSAEIRVEKVRAETGYFEWEMVFVNTSSDSDRNVPDTNLYECELTIRDLPTDPYYLESLPNSFRYDRRVPCFGINSGGEQPSQGVLMCVDVPHVDRTRPHYWNVADSQPDFGFDSIASNPTRCGSELVSIMRRWGEQHWSARTLDERARNEGWTDEMRAEATQGALDFEEECSRIERGIDLIKSDERIRRAFVLTNQSMKIASKHGGWRPFQLGFILANLASISSTEKESEIVDIVWFATGGGKTETYLGMILTASFFDRITGKISGLTAWSRFPLRMLSLQQTQRFADALAAGEQVRRREKLEGDPFSLGFLVGQGATPNSIKEEPGPDDVDYDDEQSLQSYRVLLHCPFCRTEKVKMVFDRRQWRLAHKCEGDGCPWPEDHLPFFIVDDEIYRFLPTVLVGTLDKAAAIAMQASMRGLIGPPVGQCSEDRHGYTYASRSKKPNGCLVPGCRGHRIPLPMTGNRYGPTFRLQDELHLLKDSLGAVDTHYEALYDDLQWTLCGSKPKILASSATLEGYERQVDVLYRRKARVFPTPGPSIANGFWSSNSGKLMRRYAAVSPRGVTLEFAIDRLLTELQVNVRRLVDDAENVCGEIGIDSQFAPALASLYGTNIVYGNTIRDLEAVSRSIETQVQVNGTVNTATLTGKTEFDSVRSTLHRLENPESGFEERLHVITASSMMSHGVDIDRLNVMVMLGLPLTTSEFIQATARVGRTWPGIVIVIHKIARERDAGMYRSFAQFITHGDRLIEPIPITSRSRRVLDRTIAGLEMARILMLHEPANSTPLTTISRLKDFLRTNRADLVNDASKIIEMLQLSGERDAALRADIEDWFERFIRNIENPPAGAKFPSDASPTGNPMRSLRDVEEQVPVHARYS